MIGTYIDLLDDHKHGDCFFNQQERIEAWKAIGRMVAFLARYKSDLDWQRRVEILRRQLDEWMHSGCLQSAEYALEWFAEPVPLAA